ncbi:unnamed protein product, partial [Menidia menidia]
MTSTKRMLLLVAVTIAMLDATESFQSFISSDGNSSALSGITRRAILQKTAEVCRDLAASQNREFTLRIDNSLVAEEVSVCGGGGRGVLCYTPNYLFCFYWVELGNNVPFNTLIKQDQPLTTLAADQAVNAILEDIRIAVGINSFLRLMDITPSPPLCFVIDTTGTMGFELFRIRALVSRIINERRRTLPTDYILVPFNDPGFGPVTRTSNVDEFNMIVQRLSPLGGGDPPELSLSGLRLALTQSPPYTQVFVITDAPAKDSNLKNNITALIESTECVVNFLLTIGSELAQSEQLYRDIAEASGGLAFVMKKQNFDSALSVVEDSQAGSEVTVFRIKQNPGRQNSFNFAVDVSLRSVTVYIIGASSLTFSLTSPTGVTLSSSQASGPLHSLTKIGDLNRLTLKTENEIGQWQISITSSDNYTVKITDSNASMLVTLTESVGVNVTEVILFSESTQCVGDSRYQVNFTGVPHGMYRVLLKGEDTRSRPCNFQRQSNLKIPTTQICTNSQVPSTNIEPGFNVSVSFQLSVISGGLINQSAVETFSIGASNDRGYPCSFPNTVTIEPGSRGIANDTGTMAVPADAALGSDVTLTIEAQNAAATDMNFIVIRSQVIDVTPPKWQEVSTSGNCSSSLSLCASFEWEFVANVTGTGAENITIRQGNGTMSTSIVQAGGETVIVVTYRASCCSPKVELAAVDRVGNEGRIIYFSNVKVDVALALYTNDHFDDETIQGGRDVIAAGFVQPHQLGRAGKHSVLGRSAHCQNVLPLCVSSKCEFVANVTDNINGAGVEILTIRKENRTLSNSTVVGVGGKNITVVTSASCCSPNVEQVRQSITANPVPTDPATPTTTTAFDSISSRGHALAIIRTVMISVVVSALWKWHLT